MGTCMSPSEEEIIQLSKYVCHLYGDEDQPDVNLVRFLMFKAGKYEDEMLPPNKDSLLQHIYCAAYQCYIWRTATQPILNLSNVTRHGWYIDKNGKVSVKWMSQPPAPDSILLLVNCKCVKGCETNRCLCRKLGLKCMDVYKCSDCKNNTGSGSTEDSTDSDMSLSIVANLLAIVMAKTSNFFLVTVKSSVTPGAS